MGRITRLRDEREPQPKNGGGAAAEGESSLLGGGTGGALSSLVTKNASCSKNGGWSTSAAS